MHSDTVLFLFEKVVLKSIRQQTTEGKMEVKRYEKCEIIKRSFSSAALRAVDSIPQEDLAVPDSEVLLAGELYFIN